MESKLGKIEHVVLLMLENRSFDSMLGWLYEKGSPAQNIPELKPGERAYEGLQGLNLQNFENTDATGTIKIKPVRGVQGLNVPNIAPGEQFHEVTTQLFGTETPAADAQPTMKGYVRDYTNLLRKHGYNEDDVYRYAQQVMQSHTQDQLPVLNGLAEHYAVCDMWFSSVPSQTNTNRAFAFCGTSMGLVDNGFLEEDKRAPVIEKIVGYRLGDDRFKTKTLFNAMAEGGQTSWKVFRESGMLQNNIDKMAKLLLPVINLFLANNPLFAGPGIAADVLLAYLIELSSSKLESDYVHRLFPEILKIKDADSHFGMLDEFHVAARAGKLPNFTFIEPEWSIGEKGTGESNLVKKALFHQGNDYHPPSNADSGENLVKQIYLSLIANKEAWEKTLLIITFDEPVGSFDHVPPPAAVPPWGVGNTPPFNCEQDFKFNRYGGRVPTILVSPWVKKGTVFRSTTATPYDHTSLIATLLKWRGLEQKIPDFGQRTVKAPTFENVLNLETPRQDRKDVGFLNLGHKVGEPVRYYDRFYLKAPNGKYISTFQEHQVAPFSLFSDDSAMSEYFPTLSYEPVDRFTNTVTAVTFYMQNTHDRVDNGVVARGAMVRLNAVENGLGAYNVLGAWKDSHDCYYFNDYMDGDDSRKQNWKLGLDAAKSVLSFGDKAGIENEYFKDQKLAADSRYVGYVTTTQGADGWTIVPVLDEPPGPDVLHRGSTFYLKHLASGRYITGTHKGVQWYPTLGDAAHRVKLKFPENKSGTYGSNGFIIQWPLQDGTASEIASTEDLVHGGQRCDFLMAYTNPNLYYYYENYSPDYQNWIISLVNAVGYIKSGSQVRLINKGYNGSNRKQYMVPDGGYLTTVSEDNQDSIWVIEKIS